MSHPVTVFDLQAELCLAMSHPHRLEIVNLLKAGPKRVTDIADAVQISQTAASRHLAVLRNAGILAANRQGTDVIYQVAHPKIVSICEMMRDVLSERENQRSEILAQLKR